MNTEQANKTIRVGVLGFGGLGQTAPKLLAGKGEMILVAADQKGYAYTTDSLNSDSDFCNKSIDFRQIY